MAKITIAQLAGTLEELRTEIVQLSRRIEMLEGRHSPYVNGAAAAPAKPVAAPPVRTEPEPAITEEELIAISAAIGAYLGVRPHIRQIRLVSSNAWAQQGRVSIQASHRLQG